MATHSNYGGRSSSNQSVNPDESFNDSVHLDESWFYGSSKNKQILNCVTKESIATPLINIKQASLLEKSLGDIETFPKQRLAIARLKESAKTLKNSRIFSFEIPGQTGGMRRYLVCTLDRFWSWYITLKDRHLYELITESSPCRLYFDLEYSKITNNNIDHELVYGYFMTTVQKLLSDEFNLKVDPAKDFLVLDSSTEEKFSAHVICHFPNGFLFPSNLHIRPFCVRLSEILLKNSPVKIWNADGTKETVLFDNAVYTKNRNFRLFLSSKLGSKIPSDRQVFFDSICIPANACEFPLLQVENFKEDELQLIHSIQFPSALTTIKMKEGSGPSPFVQLDEFMLMVWRKWNSSVYIRQWKIIGYRKDGQARSIVYYVGFS
ncbi:hypothetical protein DICVIV_01060 [Dictyocaulus viviparus]|uniref:DNA-directed primase/polymerase protein n=1 Tax=Dictyocaulus viviparus TaxID=29172 RepID=A0A0D8YDP0_DICVI|nr:hypothetical protein DICVIV_01060 [Dictyocaulus viviparus]